jgi:hypothetical protein
MEGVQIKNYLVLYKNETSQIYKKNKKKLSKRQLFKRFDISVIKTEHNHELESLKNYLVSVKSKHPQQVGILFDNNIIIHDITYIPTLPKNYDILCLESDIESYKSDSVNSIYWCSVNIKSSGNFIINGNSIEKVIQIINDSSDLNDFYKKLNTLLIHNITQHHFSEKSEHYVHDPLIINKNLTKDDIVNYDKKLSLDFYNKFNNLDIITSKKLHKELDNKFLPKISLICPVTDKELFFHCLLTFLRFDYPRHLLELVVVNDIIPENELHLPEDSRIKLININNTSNNTSNTKLQIGYKLNIGVKHSTNNLVMHLFDTSNYNLNLKDILSHFLLSNKNCLTSVDMGIYKSDCINIPDISNCIYTKDFWSKMAFEETSHNLYTNIDLMFKWMSFRINEIEFLPFVYLSFKLQNDDSFSLLNVNIKKIDFDLSLLVDKKIKESFDLIRLN